MLHLAFGERALLADDMGLGKTIQAIAACELLARLQGHRARADCRPASLKARMGGADCAVQRAAALASWSARAQERLKHYARPAFFTMVNYEQVVSDADDINASS